MDQDSAPVLDVIQQFRREDKYTFALPGRRLGYGPVMACLEITRCQATVWPLATQ